MKDIRLNTKEDRKEYLLQRKNLLIQLRSSVEGVDEVRLNECKENILRAYKESSLKDKFADVRIDYSIENYRFRSIGIYRKIEKSKFNAPDYYWGPYFSDVGRAIALGEEKYFFFRLGNYIRGCKETISRKRPNFEIINIKIREMLDRGIVPNVIIYPVQMSVDFIKHFKSSIDWSSDSGRTLSIEQCKLQTIWSNRYAELRSFIILDSKAGIWRVGPDLEDSNEVVIAIGDSTRNEGYIEYRAETLVYYKINNTNAFVRINLSK